MNWFERIFERSLWESRFVVLVAVIASLLSAFAMFFIATVDVYSMLSHLGDYVAPGLDTASRTELRSTMVAHVVEIVDGYLLATVLLIFSLGLYELFISKIDLAEGCETSSNVLLITSLDDLKGRLAKVIFMILVVKFFEHAIAMEFHGPDDLLKLAGAMALVGVLHYLTHSKGHSKP